MIGGYRMAGNRARALLLYQNLLRIYGNNVPNRAEVEGHIAEKAGESQKCRH